MATFTTPLPAPVKNDWLPTGENPRLSPPSPGGQRKVSPVQQVNQQAAILLERPWSHFRFLSKGSMGNSAGRGPPPAPAGGRPAPAIPNRPGGKINIQFVLFRNIQAIIVIFRLSSSSSWRQTSRRSSTPSSTHSIVSIVWKFYKY